MKLPASSCVQRAGPPPGPLAKEITVNSVALIGRLTASPTTHAGEKHESATF
jgi:hypothetical protein